MHSPKHLFPVGRVGANREQLARYVKEGILGCGSQENATFPEITPQFDVPPAQEKEIVGLLTPTYNGAFELLKKQFTS